MMDTWLKNCTYENILEVFFGSIFKTEEYRNKETNEFASSMEI
jgi:hypothetical protein